MFFYQDHHRGSVKERLGESAPLSLGDKVTVLGSTITKTIVNTEATSSKEEGEAKPVEESEEMTVEKETKKAAAIAAIKKNQEVLELKAKMKKEADLKKVDALKKTDELRKSKQDLLEKLIDEQKKLILKMEEKKSQWKPEEKSKMMALLKTLTSSIDKTREDIKAILSQNQNVRKSFLDVQKELLDAELELFNAQQDSAENVDDIQKRVNKLRLEAAQRGFLPTSRPARGRGSLASGRGSPRGAFTRGGWRGRSPARGCFRGRGRGSYAGTTTLDRRPTTIMVSEVDAECKDAAIAHLSKFGEVVDSTEEDGGKVLTVQYKTRREAESAMLKGKQMGEMQLNLSWHNISAGDASELEHDETEESRLDDTADLLDDYTPLDPTYLPPGLEDVEKRVINS
jgi:RNA-binding protein 26